MPDYVLDGDKCHILGETFRLVPSRPVPKSWKFGMSFDGVTFYTRTNGEFVAMIGPNGPGKSWEVK